MKKYLFSLMAVACLTAATAHAHPEPANQHPGLPITIQNNQLGSGDPSLRGEGTSQAVPVLGNNIYHAPQYMPGYPTSATIFPRVVDLKCQSAMVCDGYNWSPALGRGEYLFVRQAVITPPLIEKVNVPVMVPGPERIILQEVPPKKKRE